MSVTPSQADVILTQIANECPHDWFEWMAPLPAFMPAMRHWECKNCKKREDSIERPAIIISRAHNLNALVNFAVKHLMKYNMKDGLDGDGRCVIATALLNYDCREVHARANYDNFPSPDVATCHALYTAIIRAFGKSA